MEMQMEMPAAAN